MKQISAPTQKFAIFDVEQGRWEDDDGFMYQRDVVRKPGAVAILASDASGFWLVWQQREAINSEMSLEVPAGLLDVSGEEPLDCAKRELAEEIGRTAAHWETIAEVYTSPGFTDEKIHLFWATGLQWCRRPEADDKTSPEKIDFQWLGRYIQDCRDAKTLIALQWLKLRREGQGYRS